MDPSSFSYMNLANLKLIEELYERYLSDPAKVDPSWRYFFEGWDFALKTLPKAREYTGKEDLRVFHLIEAYRRMGHRAAACNPLALHPPQIPKELTLEKFHFSEKEMKALFPTDGLLPEREAALSQIVDTLRKTYCRTIGIEYMGLGRVELEEWVQKKIEPNFEIKLSNPEKIAILEYLNKAELFESFIHTRYVGQKRFSLEGGETLIPLLAMMLKKGKELGIDEAVLGMAHRGRLNILANILGKSYGMIFHEFEDHYSPSLEEGSGDVKYHKGFAGELLFSGGDKIAVTLAANPSHLESVDPVVLGITRVKQDFSGKQVVPILIHGDGAIAGQGVVYESLQLSKLPGYSTGGTVHIVINNQIGFTTLPKHARSTHYCTDIAKTFGAPVFHVNAEDPQGCVYAAQLAIEIRQRFGCDVFIDLNCYRKYGHNEGDEPKYTQPLEYEIIENKKAIRAIYRDKLIAEKILSQQESDRHELEFREELKKEIELSKKPTSELYPPILHPEIEEKIITKVNKEELLLLTEKICTVPANFQIHPKIERLLKQRLQMPGQDQIDWGMGELLAYATLLWQEIPVRISGQDVARGTFSHRQAMWVDQKEGTEYFPLAHLKSKFYLYNSPLSEFAVLGFEFGYSLIPPHALVIWEAQFGDFCNEAQVIIDQYIVSSEQKWNLCSNLTLFLPHGYEGQGPEHSSARMERFLQLCGNDNIQVVNCTLPAQLFHVLRRQALEQHKKPLILFTPKTLLRHPRCKSAFHEFYEGEFHPFLHDPTPPEKTKKLVLCSGKIFYELIEEREKRKASHIAILRIEQLHPLDKAHLKKEMARYEGFEECVWVQEEHKNMGAWEYMKPLLNEILDHKLHVNYIGRDKSASTAAGSYHLHQKELTALMNALFK